MENDEAVDILVSAFLRMRPNSSIFGRAEHQGALKEFMTELQSYAPLLLAVTLRLHLEALLKALLESQVCTREEVRRFFCELEREVLQYETE
jgi:hypothetical protein